MIKKLLYLAILSIAFALNGCSTFVSNYGISAHQKGNYYSGTKLNFMEWNCYSKSVINDPGFIFAAPLVVPIMLVDLPLSIVGDTLYIPIDVSTKAEHSPLVVANSECADFIDA
jgi:uncharacterized protein YceK